MRSEGTYPWKISYLTNANPPFLSDQKIVFVSESAPIIYFDVEGYHFAYQATGSNTYYCGAYPITPGKTGDRTFRIDNDGVVKVYNGSDWDPLY